MNAVLSCKKSEESICVEQKHFPDLYQSADSVSQLAQRCYFSLQKCYIILLICGSVSAVSAMATPIAIIGRVYAISALFLGASIILHWVSRVRRDDKVWFDCRAVAESTKTLSWRFMMKIAPFQGDDSTAIRLFVEMLKKIRKARPFSVQKHLAKRLNPDTQPVSDVMLDVRHMDTSQRHNLYLESRLHDQVAWYLRQAELNSKKESFWFWTISTIQTLAIGIAVVQIFLSGLPINVIPFLLTCAASSVAWSQIKRYGELAQAYSLAVQELKEQQAIAANTIEESAFLTLVESIEETISREHTMWLARRAY